MMNTEGAGRQFYLHDGVESRLEAAQMLLLHLDALGDLLLCGLRLTVLHRQPLHKETDVAFLASLRTTLNYIQLI